MTMGLSRLERYRAFIDHEFAPGLFKPHEYTMDEMSPDLARRIRAGAFRRIVFTGMGCSAIVSDVLRGFLVAYGVNIDVFVLNDYDATFLLPAHIIENEATLIIISSYSGHSREPIIALERLVARKDRIVLLTSGGQLAEYGRQLGVSTIYWRPRNPDREYPLFHVTQYFSILLDVFHRLGLLPDNYQSELAGLATDLARGAAEREVLAHNGLEERAPRASHDLGRRQGESIGLAHRGSMSAVTSRAVARSPSLRDSSVGATALGQSLRASLRARALLRPPPPASESLLTRARN